MCRQPLGAVQARRVPAVFRAANRIGHARSCASIVYRHSTRELGITGEEAVIAGSLVTRREMGDALIARFTGTGNLTGVKFDERDRGVVDSG